MTRDGTAEPALLLDDLYSAIIKLFKEKSERV